MKRFIIILWGIMIISTTLFAQIESTKSLARCATNIFQSEEVVVIDGVTFSPDLKTLIKYPVDKTDEKYVVPEGTKTISESAFERVRWLKKLILPFSLDEIGNYAFKDCYYIDSIGWNNFPDKIGIKAFDRAIVQSFYVLNDSCNCVLYDEDPYSTALYSKDKKRLLLVPTGSSYEIVPEGVEVIGKGAYESNIVTFRVYLPSTLKCIEDLAFFRSTGGLTSYPDDDEVGHLFSVECKALVPPAIIGNPFAHVREIELEVPSESFELYCNAPVWKDFYSINGVRVSVEKIACEPTTVHLDNQTISIQSEKDISCVRLYDQNGGLVVSKVISSNPCTFDIDRIISGLLFLEITYQDATRKIFKLYK